MAGNSLVDLEKKMSVFFSRFPSLPSKTKKLFVNRGPVVVFVCGLLIIFLSGLINIFFLGGPPKNYQFSSYNFYLQTIFNLIAGTILILSFKPLKQKKLSGWQMVFYLTLLETVLSIFIINLVGLIICFLSFYFLFQVRENFQ